MANTPKKPHKKKGRKADKIGGPHGLKHRKQCERYRLVGKRERNRDRRVARIAKSLGKARIKREEAFVHPVMAG